MKANQKRHPSASPCPGPATAPGGLPELSIDVLGHELDNVLNGLLGMARLLRDSGLNAEQDRWSRAIETSGRQMRRLVSAFRVETSVPLGGGLPLAERGSGRMAPRSAPIDGIELLEQAVLSQVPCAVAQGNRLLLDVDPGLSRYWRTDSCRLRQLLDNLLGNANKFTRGGEVRLRAGPSRGRSLLLEVADTGPGVDPHSTERIFEAGQRDARPGDAGQAGSGLGLYVCRGVAAALGGTIRLSSPTAGGARFDVELPGLLPAGGRSRAPDTCLFDRLECRLDLRGALRDSVAGWLLRLGVRCHGEGPDECGAGEGRQVLGISELPAVGEPAPLLLLTPENGPQARRLAGPVTGSSLGQALLGILLEVSWLRRGTPGSVPPPPR